jgi:hypothetical protein
MIAARRWGAAAWWAPAWLGLALLHSLTGDSSVTHWAQLWSGSFGWLAFPFWAGWFAPSMVDRAAPPYSRVAAAAVACLLWQLALRGL